MVLRPVRASIVDAAGSVNYDSAMHGARSNRSVLITIIAVCFMLSGTSAQSHHGFYGQYSLDDRIDLTGTVVAVEWANPHASVLVSTEFEGAEVVIRVELRSLTQLADRGWKGDELAIGEAVRVVNAAPSVAQDSNVVCCARIYDLNGTEFFTDPRRVSARPDQ